MRKEKKLQEIAEFLDIDIESVSVKNIYEISEDLQNDDYEYCQKIYDISEQLDNDDYSKCKKILEISEDGEYDIDNLICLMNYADEIGEELNIYNIDRIEYQSYFNSEYGIDDEDLLNNLWNYNQDFDKNCDIARLSKNLSGDYHELEKLLELKNNYGIDNNNELKIYLEIIEETDCDVTDTFNIRYISSEILDYDYFYIYKNLLPIYNELDCNADKLEDIYSVSSAIDSEDYFYCLEIYQYMNENNIENAKEAEKLYKLEQEQN